MSAEKDAAHQAFAAALRPLVRMVLAAGGSCAEASDVLRHVFIEEARRVLIEDGVAPTVSAIAVKTGLYRSVVAQRLAQSLDAGLEKQVRKHRLTRLLEGWHTHPLFTDARGLPVELPLEGRRSFEELVARYVPSVYPTALLDELLRVSAVEWADDEHTRLRVLKRTASAGDVTVDALRTAGEHAAHVLDTLRINAEHPRAPRFAGAAIEFQVSPLHVPRLRNLIRERAEVLLRSAQEAISDVGNLSTAGDGVKLGVFVAEIGDADGVRSATAARPSLPVRGVKPRRPSGLKKRVAKKRSARRRSPSR